MQYLPTNFWPKKFKWKFAVNRMSSYRQGLETKKLRSWILTEQSGPKKLIYATKKFKLAPKAKTRSASDFFDSSLKGKGIFSMGPLVAPISLDIWLVDLYSWISYHWQYYERKKQGFNHPKASWHPSVRYMLSNFCVQYLPTNFWPKSLSGNLQ